MRVDRDGLLERIRLGEDGFLELKEVRLAGSRLIGPSQDVLADELAALANGAGGELVLGVSDAPRAVVGIPLEQLDAVEAVVRQACEQSVKPALQPVIERLNLPDAEGRERPILRIAVQRSLFVHLSPGGYLQRVGAARRPIPPDQLARLFQQRSQARLIRFDETPVSGAELAVLDEGLWRRFAPEGGEEADETLLAKLAMASRDEQGVLRPTVAGLLMGSRHPERFLPGAFIQAVAYRGTDIVPDGGRNYQLDAADLKGPLDRQIEDGCAFVRRNMRVGARKAPEGGREDLPQFDMLAVFEALTNAVAHRDYSIAGSKVRLRMFEDRLELYTPGMLPNTMTPASLPYRQSSRNEAIASLLARCPVSPGLGGGRRYFMDRRGEGVPIILRNSERLSGRRPEFAMHDDSELVLTIFAATGD